MMKKRNNTIQRFVKRHHSALHRAITFTLVFVMLVSSTPMEAMAAGAEAIATGVVELTEQPAGDEATGNAGAEGDTAATGKSAEGDGAEQGTEGSGSQAATGNGSVASGEADGEAAEEDAQTADETEDTTDDASAASQGNNGSGEQQEPASGSEEDGDASKGQDATKADNAPTAELTTRDGLTAVTLEADAAASKRAAAQALQSEAGVDAETAQEAANIAFESTDDVEMAPAERDGEDLPSSGDGSFVDDIAVSWITEDTEDNGDDSLLYVRPEDNASQIVRMRVSFALSGSHDYDPGEVTITIPTNILQRRNGRPAGNMRLAVPESPSTSAAWNYQQIDDTYVITNTRRLSAATQGFIEFSIEEIVPREMVDMAVSNQFDAQIEVVTSDGNIIGSKSNQITAQFDTFAEITDATTRVYTQPHIVTPDEIPESQRIPGVEAYVLVTWYMHGYIDPDSNQNHTLELVDRKDDALNGFVINVTGTSETQEREITLYENGYDVNTTTYTLIEAAYPIDQFEENHTYAFGNEVTYTLTETDTQRSTTATSSVQVEWTYQPAVFVVPNGFFNHFDYGNSNVPYAEGSESMESVHPATGNRMPDLVLGAHQGVNPIYRGDYPSGLNYIRRGEGETISFTTSSVGFMLPWTYKEGTVDTPEGGNPAGQLGNYGQIPVTMVSEVEGLTYQGNALTAGTDYTYESVEFPITPTIYKAEAINLDENGNVEFEYAQDGTVDYSFDEDPTHIPDIDLQVQLNGGTEWHTYATASWKSGRLVVTFAEDGTTQTRQIVNLPEGTTGVRTTVTAKNAGLHYHLRVNYGLLADGALGTVVDELFADAVNPWMELSNSSNMVVYSGENNDIFTIDRTAFDRLSGYSADTLASIEKTGEKVAEDQEARQVTVRYGAEVTVQSYITDQSTYEQALEDGELQAETGGTWYDLLPKGMTPLLDTVTLRDGDSIREMYTIEDYRGSGRTMLVVSAYLTPTANERDEGDLSYFEDHITIEFDATYSYESVESFGAETHNVIAYMSDNEQLGSVEGYRGEPDNSSGNNNVGTEHAFDDATERELMDNLDPDRDDPNTLYAGATTLASANLQGLTELTKLVQVNSDGWWSSGIEGRYDDNTGWVSDESQARDVYVGGRYSYRLGFRNGSDTEATGIILYDSLENFEPAETTFDPGDQEDVNTGNIWRGTFEGIDVSPLEALGCAPVVYYSTEPELKLDEWAEDNPDGGSEPRLENMLYVNGELNTDVWQPLTSETDLSTVKAIAVDATKTADGSDFVLAKAQVASAYVDMRAPSGEDTATLIKHDAHAFNSTCMQAYTVGSNEYQFIHNEYTKVGLTAYDLTVAKEWDDANNQDGTRPGSVTVHLYVDGMPVEEAFPEYNWNGVTTEITLSDESNWKGAFENLPRFTDDGEKINYTLMEQDLPEGYIPDIRFDGDNTFTIINRYEPEALSISGTKTWVGDTEEVRPGSIVVELFADGVLAQTKTVRPDASGNWFYTFDNLDKYRDGGTEIVYTVQESDDSAPSYSSTVPEGTWDLVNTYHPYGDLRISKAIEGVTDVSRDKDFTFTLQFTREVEDGDNGTVEEPVFDEFAYTVFDAEGTEIGNGNVATNGTITLKGGQYAVIKEIPGGINYQIIEASAPGFVEDSTGASGVIEPNDEVEAAFTNTYSASVSVNLGARKVLDGRDLTAYQFRFELRDEEGNVVRTASNSAADVEETGENGPVEQAPVTFGAITYTQEDHGKTFTYTVHEVATDRGGYTYDDMQYTVEVTPRDRGDGTMSVDVVYKNDAGEVIQGGSGKDTDVVFHNTYRASAGFTPQVNKSITGGELQEGAFDFELGRVLTAEDGSTSFEPIGDVATNAADGTVTFSEIPYSQVDAEQTFLYAIHELPGNDETVTYDEHWSLVQVEVSDNGDGTLSLQTTFNGLSARCWVCGGDGKLEGDADCAACGGTGTIKPADGSYEFVNEYNPGSLDIEKTLSGESEGGDPNQLFNFRVELTNEEGEPIDVTADDVSFSEIGAPAGGAGTEEAADGEAVAADEGGAAEPAAEDEQAQNPLVALGNMALDFLGGIFGPTDAYAAEIDSGEIDNDDGTSWYWSFDDNGTLTLGGNIKYDVPTTGTISSTWGPWRSHAPQVTRVEFVEGSKAYGNVLHHMFFYHLNLKQVDFNGLDVSEAENMSLMFGLCTSLESVDFTGVDTLNVTNMASVFMWDRALTSVIGLDTESVVAADGLFQGCSALETIDFSQFDTSNMTNMSSMFLNCKSLPSIDFSSFEKFDTSKVTNMSSMFTGCDSFVTIDLSKFDTANVTNMSSMFTGCDSLTSLDVSTLNTSSVTDMSMMFDGSSLTSLDISSFNTNNVVNMSAMFRNCTALTDLELSGINTSKVTAMSEMFGGCSALTTLDISELDTSSVTNMSQMFANCGSLDSLDLSGFNTSSAVTLERMFDGCSSLASLDVSRFETSKVTSMFAMFRDCSSLESLSISGIDTSNVIRMHDMFSGCSSLTSLDLSSFSTESMSTSSISQSDWLQGTTSLRSITLGESFSFVGPDCAPCVPGTGKQTWVHLDAEGNPEPDRSYTSDELASGYGTTAPVGTYVWDTWITVTFNVNGGQGSMASQPINTAEDVVLSSSNGSIYKPGQRFVGWNTQADGTGDAFVDGGTIPANTFLDRTELTLYAQWDEFGHVSNPTDGVLEISMPAGYVAHLEDLPAGTSYRVYEETPEGWMLVDSSNSTGTIVPGDTQTASFVNEYAPSRTSAQIVASKTLDGAWANAASGFQFQLYETTSGSREPVGTPVTVADGGSVVFPLISYGAAGDHTYEIEEIAGKDSTINYDGSIEKVTVSVTEGTDGTLSAAVTYDGEDSDPDVAAFQNTTVPGSLSIGKTTEGALSERSQNQEFSFLVTVSGSPYSGAYTVGRDERTTTDGTMRLKGGETALIEGLAPGSSYAVSEIETPAGWTLTDSAGLTGSIESGATAQVAFTNTYSASGEVQLMAYKRLSGGDLVEGQFTFQLLNESGEVIDTAVNGPVDTNESIMVPNPDDNPTDPSDDYIEQPNPAYGKAPVYFSALTCTTLDSHTYTIREVVPADAVNAEGVRWEDATAEQKAAGGFALDGVVYDGTVREAEVTVEDNGNGTLATSVTYSDPAGSDTSGNTFANSMEELELTVRKEVQNYDDLSEAAAANASFEFTLSLKTPAGEPVTQQVNGRVYNASDEPVGEAFAIADGGTFQLEHGQYALLTGIPYGSMYEVAETAKLGWSQVTDATTGTSGELTGEGTEAVFTNAYSASGQIELEAVKKYNGGTPEDGQFSFALEDTTEGSESNGQLLQTAQNDATGLVTFKPLEYTAADAGKTFTYSIYEIDGGEENIAYDKTIVEAQVTVTDNGDGTLKCEVTYDGEGNPHTFENWFAVTLARTGGAGIGLTGAAVVALGCAGYVWRKRKKGPLGKHSAR